MNYLCLVKRLELFWFRISLFLINDKFVIIITNLCTSPMYASETSEMQSHVSILQSRLPLLPPPYCCPIMRNRTEESLLKNAHQYNFRIVEWRNFKRLVFNCVSGIE